MRIGINMGHTLSGAGTGASSVYAVETQKNREVGNMLINMLREKGHTVVNCTIDKSSNDLADAVAIANANSLDLFVSLHLNAFKVTSTAMGVETYIFNGAFPNKTENKTVAQRIQTELVKTVGWKDRKVKEDNFYVLRNTISNAVLVELGFCDSQADMSLFNTKKVAEALFKGITNTTYTTSSNSESTPSNTFYRVVTGSYNSRANADAQIKRLKDKGFDSFIEVFKK